MRIREIAAVAAALLAAHAAPTAAQRSGDRSRLVFTVSAAYTGGGGLWSISSQPVQQTSADDTLPTTDNIAISRSIKNTFSGGVSGTYYRGEHLGLTADAFLLGLGFDDACTVVPPIESDLNRQICEDIDGQDKSAAAATLSVGAVFRAFSREAISPFARVSAGLLFSNQSSVLMQGIRDDNALLTIYEDSKRTRVSPSLALGVGATTPIGRAYHLRWEVRDNIVGIEAVTGPTSAPRFEPPHERKYKHLFSVLIGIDVILERSRGRRY